LQIADCGLRIVDCYDAIRSPQFAPQPAVAGVRVVPRGWVLVLGVVLLLWRPFDFALELPAVLPSLATRGTLGALELLFHGVVAATAVAAVRALWGPMPSARTFAAIGLIASAAASVQSLYWSVLPHQTMPSDKPLIAGAAIVHALVWLAYLARSRRVRELVE
jgi:hypothetical protein